jgi:hypothetical protein
VSAVAGRPLPSATFGHVGESGTKRGLVFSNLVDSRCVRPIASFRGLHECGRSLDIPDIASFLPASTPLRMTLCVRCDLSAVLRRSNERSPGAWCARASLLIVGAQTETDLPILSSDSCLAMNTLNQSRGGSLDKERAPASRSMEFQDNSVPLAGRRPICASSMYVLV